MPNAKEKIRRTLPIGCKIVSIRRGKGDRERMIYCNLVDSKGETIICADIDYISTQLHLADFVSQERYDELCNPKKQEGDGNMDE